MIWETPRPRASSPPLKSPLTEPSKFSLPSVEPRSFARRPLAPAVPGRRTLASRATFLEAGRAPKSGLPADLVLSVGPGALAAPLAQTLLVKLAQRSLDAGGASQRLLQMQLRLRLRLRRRLPPLHPRGHWHVPPGAARRPSHSEGWRRWPHAAVAGTWTVVKVPEDGRAKLLFAVRPGARVTVVADALHPELAERAFRGRRGSNGWTWTWTWTWQGFSYTSRRPTATLLPHTACAGPAWIAPWRWVPMHWLESLWFPSRRRLAVNHLRTNRTNVLPAMCKGATVSARAGPLLPEPAHCALRLAQIHCTSASGWSARCGCKASVRRLRVLSPEGR
mmetsp:Transcript_73711/g.159513  ORF Transcript_73711/g.159513 Transcript_73711/m.159513 type:complete len:335 (-) Transcript_73711:568-1572(-)